MLRAATVARPIRIIRYGQNATDQACCYTLRATLGVARSCRLVAFKRGVAIIAQALEAVPATGPLRHVRLYVRG